MHALFSLGPFCKMSQMSKHRVSNQFISVDAKGTVAQGDCWVTSYPEYFFGNMFREADLTGMLKNKPRVARFRRTSEASG